MKIAFPVVSIVMLFVLSACGSDQKQESGTNPAPAVAGSGGSSEQDGAGQDDAGQSPNEQQPRRTRRPKVNTAMVMQLFGSNPTVPKVDNPITDEKVALGKALFHSAQLSKDGSRSCATCHVLGDYGVDHQKTPAGTPGKRNTPTVYNAARQFAQFWDYRAQTVEQAAVMHATGPDGNGLADEAELVAKIRAEPELVAAFGEAFPDAAEAVTAENFGLAVGAFLRTLTTKSRWDAFLDGDRNALTNEELVGLNTFLEVGCQTCHVMRTLGGHIPQKLGLLKPYPTEDTGRMQATGKEMDKFMFKVPSLLNIEKTAPYNHDGAYASLDETIVNMANIQLNRQLTDEQTKAIIAFLKAATGELPDDYANR
jgi:cytochrome c peroxidase